MIERHAPCRVRVAFAFRRGRYARGAARINRNPSRGQVCGVVGRELRDSWVGVMSPSMSSQRVGWGAALLGVVALVAAVVLVALAKPGEAPSAPPVAPPSGAVDVVDAGPWDEFRATGTKPIVGGEAAHLPVWCFTSRGAADTGELDPVCSPTAVTCEEARTGEVAAAAEQLDAGIIQAPQVISPACSQVTRLWCMDLPVSVRGERSRRCLFSRADCESRLENMRQHPGISRDTVAWWRDPARVCEERWAQ